MAVTVNYARPFLRWAGGKSRFVGEIVSRLPKLPPGGTYYEPFLGAGSVFLSYSPEQAVLSDLNPDLIATFRAIKRDADRVAEKLYRFRSRDSEDFFYRIRDRFNSGGSVCLQAARFIYLNQTCFNGIYRVNQAGEFNVPYGFKDEPQIPGIRHLREVARALRCARLKVGDYPVVLRDAKPGDVVYMDPPYPPLNGTSFFTHYTKERFADADQIELAHTANALCDRGCAVFVTNADTPLIRSLYRDWSLIEITRARFVSSSKKKHRVVELLLISPEHRQGPNSR